MFFPSDSYRKKTQFLAILSTHYRHTIIKQKFWVDHVMLLVRFFCYFWEAGGSCFYMVRVNCGLQNIFLGIRLAFFRSFLDTLDMPDLTASTPAC